MTDVLMPEAPESLCGAKCAPDDLKMALPSQEEETTGSDVAKEAKQAPGKGPLKKKGFYRRRRYSNSIRRSVSTASWQERRDEARRRRAAIRRQSLGLPVAPYNTTQFLMEEHKAEQPDVEELDMPRRRRGDSFNSVDSYGEDCYSSSYEDDEYLHAQFCAEYEKENSERLDSMSKAELVHEYLLLEARIDSLEEELKAVKKAEETDQPMEVHATEEEITKIQVFQQEISKLQDENLRLRRENDSLRDGVRSSSSANVQN